MSGLGAVSRGYLLHRKGSTIMTGLGVMIGVGLLFAVVVSNASISEGLEARQREFTGPADIEVFAVGLGGSVLPSDVVPSLTALEGVEQVTTWYTPAATEEDGSAVFITGIDANYADVSSLPLKDDGVSRVPGQDANEVLVTEGQGYEIGDEVTVKGAVGTLTLEVVGLLEEKGIGRLRDGTFKVTSIETAQRLAATSGAVSTARATLAAGIDPAEFIDEHELAIDGARIGRATGQGSGPIPGGAFIGIATITLFIAAFLIYLTLSGAVLERTAVYGTMRAIGATRGQIIKLVVGEAANLGLVASAAGLVLGGLLGILLAGALSAASDLPSARLTIPPAWLFVSVLIGVGISSLAALAPAWRAGRLSPTVAMRGDVLSRTKVGKGWIVGAVLVAQSLFLISLGPTNTVLSLFSLLTFLVGVVFVIPVVLGPVARVAGMALRPFTKGLTSITLMHVTKERNRSAYTTGLILVVLAFGVSIGSTQASLNQAIDRFADDFADVNVLSPSVITDETFDTVVETEGIDKVSPLRFGGTSVPLENGTEAFAGLAIIDPATYFDIQPLQWEDGNDEDAKKAFSAGGAVAITKPMAEQLGYEKGDRIKLLTQAGEQEFEIIGLTAGSGGYEVRTGVLDGDQYFGGGQPFGIIASVKDGFEPADVRATLRDRLHAGDEWENGGADFNVAGPDEFRESFQSNVGVIITIYQLLLAVSLLAGVLGMANTLAMAVVQRIREMGVLRALGVQQRSIRAMVVIEALLLTGLAYALALPVGAIASRAQNNSVQAAGFTVDLALPAPGLLILLLIVAVAAALIASYLPAKRAARTSIVDAVRVE